MLPLHGTKTHPMSSHAIGRLRELLNGPIPVRNFNPGVVNRLQREDFVEVVDLPSPFLTHKGRNTTHLRITTKGRKFLLNNPILIKAVGE